MVNPSLTLTSSLIHLLSLASREDACGALAMSVVCTKPAVTGIRDVKLVSATIEVSILWAVCKSSPDQN